MNSLQHIIRTGVSIGIAAALAACGGGHGHDHDHDGGHSHSAKFGGSLVQLGDHFANLEVVHDGEAGRLTVYCMDAHAESTVKSSTEQLLVNIDLHDGEPFQLVLEAEESTVTGNKKGESSKFTGADDRLKGLDHVHASLANVEVLGTEFEDIKLDVGSHGGDEDHGDEDHDGNGESGHGGEDSDG